MRSESDSHPAENERVAVRVRQHFAWSGLKDHIPGAALAEIPLGQHQELDLALPMRSEQKILDFLAAAVVEDHQVERHVRRSAQAGQAGAQDLQALGMVAMQRRHVGQYGRGDPLRSGDLPDELGRVLAFAHAQISFRRRAASDCAVPERTSGSARWEPLREGPLPSEDLSRTDAPSAHLGRHSATRSRHRQPEFSAGRDRSDRSVSIGCMSSRARRAARPGPERQVDRHLGLPQQSPKLHAPTLQPAVRIDPVGVRQTEYGRPPAGQFEIPLTLGQPVVRLTVRQVRVVVVLVDHGDRFAGIDDRPALQTGVVDHPVIPPGATEGERRHLLEARAREHEVVAASRRMPAAARPHLVAQSLLPSHVEAQRLAYRKVPALAHHQERLEPRAGLACALPQIRQQNDVGVDVAQQAMCGRLACQGEHGVQQRRAARRARHLQASGALRGDRRPRGCRAHPRARAPRRPLPAASRRRWRCPGSGRRVRRRAWVR